MQGECGFGVSHPVSRPEPTVLCLVFGVMCMQGGCGFGVSHLLVSHMLSHLESAALCLISGVMCVKLTDIWCHVFENKLPFCLKSAVSL